MIKKRFYLFLILIVLFICLPGCFPKKIVWSPNGKWGAVCLEDGLYFTDAQGNLSEQVYPQGPYVGWLSDSETLVVEECYVVHSWDEIEKTATDKTKQFIKGQAQALADSKTKDQWNKSVKDLELNENEIEGIKIYIRDSGEISASEQVKKQCLDKPEFYIYKINLIQWKNGKCSLVKEMCEFILPVWDIRVSANDKFATLATCEPDDGDDKAVTALWILDIEKSKVTLLDNDIAIYPDWSADGKSVIYARAMHRTDDEIEMGHLMSVRVIDDNGEMVNKIESPEMLGGLMMSWMTKVRCLADGKIIIASLDLKLPVATNDFSEQMQLYVLDTKMKSGINPLILKSELYKLDDYDLNLFEVSGNSRYISMTDHHGRIAVLDVTAGSVNVIQCESVSNNMPVSVPVWRGDSELYYLSRDKENDNKPVVMMKEMTSSDLPAKFSSSWNEDILERMGK